MKLRHFKTKNNFELVLNRGGEIEDVDLCFIKDSGEIWTHGKYYCLIDSEFSDSSGLPLSNSTITDAFIELEESTAAAIDKIRASVGLDQELEYQDTVDNTGSIDEALRVLDNIKLDKSQKGVPGGLATLDQNGKISNSQLSITTDNELSETSENPVQNKVIYATLSEIEEIIAAAINKLKESLGLTRTLDYSGTIDGAVSLDDADKKLHDLIVGSPKNVIIADINTNPELIGIAKTAGWTTEDCLYQYQAEGVTSLSGIDFSSLTHFNELKYFTGLTEIEESIFEGCNKITSIEIPSSVTKIKELAFCDARKITSITIPSGVTIIEGSAFTGCTGITSIEIPSSVTTIGAWAFDSCRGLTSIDIPSNVTNIGSSAFTGCTGLTSITIPSSITSIRDHTFDGCRGLTSITIPNNVTSIEGSAFWRCSSLTSVVLGKSVSSVEDEVFYNCSSLNCIISLNPVAPTLSGADTFTGMPNTGTLYHPFGSDYSSWTSALPSGWVSRELVYSEEGKAGGDIEVIIGTHGTTATGAWRGNTRDTALYDGKLICYTSRSAGSGNASLELTFPNGTTTGALPIFFSGTSRLTTHNVADTPCIYQYRKDTNSWRRMSNYYNDTQPYQLRNYNTYKTKGSIVANSLIVGDSTGYITAQSGVTFDITYPIMYSTSAYSGANKDFSNSVYYTKYSATLRNNTSSSWTATIRSTVYLVGTLDGTTFTINSTVLTSTIPTTEDGLLYIPIGLMYSTYQAYVFGYQVELYKFYGGKFQKYNCGDYALRSEVGDATITIQKNGTSVGNFTTNASTNKSINITVPTAVSNLTDADYYLRKGESIPTANSTLDGSIRTANLFPNKRTSEFNMCANALSGRFDYLYCAHLKPSVTITSSKVLNPSYMFNGDLASDALVKNEYFDTLETDPAIIELTWTSLERAVVSDTTYLMLLNHQLVNGDFLTNYKVEIYSVNSSSNSPFYGNDGWNTVLRRENVRDQVNGLCFPLGLTKGYSTIKGIRITIYGVEHVVTWTSHFPICEIKMIDTRPSFTAAQGLGGLDIKGGNVYGNTKFYDGIEGDLSGTLNGYSITNVTALPSNPDANTIYLITDN